MPNDVPTYSLDSVVTDSNTLSTEVQTVTITGAAAGGGNFRLNFDGEQSGKLAAAANSATIQAALVAMSNLSADDITAVRVADVITLTFSPTGAYAQQNVPAFTVTNEELVDAEEEAIEAAVATLTAGGAATNAVKRGTGLADRTADTSPLAGESPAEVAAENEDYE